MLGHIVGETRHIKPQFGGIFEQVLVFERVLILVKRIVHLPELPLRASRLRRFRRGAGVRMCIGQWEMSKDVAQPLSQSFLDRFYDREGFSTVGTFVIAIFDERDIRGVRTLDMIAVPDLGREFAWHWSPPWL